MDPAPVKSLVRPVRRGAIPLLGTLVALACLSVLTGGAGFGAAEAAAPDLAPLASTPRIERLAGPTRIETAIAVSQRLHPGTAPAVVIATGYEFPDALTGGPLAHLVGGPLLLVTGDSLGTGVRREIRRLSPERAFVLGGHAAIPAAIDSELRALGVGQVVRLSGPTRFDTAAAIAERMLVEGASSDRAIVVSGRAWPDAASAGPIAAVLGCPIVLADGGTLPTVSRSTLAEWGTTRTLVAGGPAAVPQAVLSRLPDPERIGGADRYETSSRLATRGLALGLAEGTIVVASGLAFPDALAGAPLAADARAPILLTRSDALSAAARQFINGHAAGTGRAVLLGGTTALSPPVESAIRSLLGGTGSTDWPDTSSRVAVFSDQVSESISDDQLAFVATHYDGSQKQTRSFTRRLRAHDSDYLVVHYRLGLGLSDVSHIIEGDSWVPEWPSSPADSWFYIWSGGRVYQHQWNWYLINVDDPPWRTWWTGEVARQIATNENDGLFIDSYSVPNYLGGSNYTPPLPGFDAPFEAEWTARMDRYSAYLMGRSALRPVIANVGYWVTSRDAVDYGLLDGVMIEGLGEWGPGSPFDEGDWVLQQERILSLTRRGRIVLGQSYLSPGDMQTRRMVTASYLMSKGPRSYLCLEVGSEPEWFPEYDLDLGTATDALPPSADAFRLASGLYRRRFQRGVVLVNPTGSPIAVSVASVAGGGDWDLATFTGGGPLPSDGDTSGMSIDRTPTTNLTVQAHDAAFLLPR